MGSSESPSPPFTQSKVHGGRVMTTGPFDTTLPRTSNHHSSRRRIIVTGVTRSVLYLSTQVCDW